MQGTRTPAQLLVGAAVAAALTGCVAVDGPPQAPAPAPVPATDPVRPAHDVEPQIVLQGPAREALEAALPSPAPTAAVAPPRGETRRATGHAAPSRTAAPKPSSPAAGRPSAPPPAPRVSPPAAPDVRELERLAEQLRQTPPVAGKDVCDLGERYGGWDPASVQAGLCRSAYER
ncbi:hypothetical protein ACF1CG_30320 [Streptomyces sp. NPDC014773]|uniref:hypothetical protein n=1 Tax=Streptomyces sp. NPDC014773 TaxID=3364908 RepID=UPI0036FA6638